MKRKLTLTLILTALVCLLLSVSAGAVVVDSGTCGTNLTWELDDQGVLTISGSGAMKNYNGLSIDGKNVTEAPWRNNSTRVIIGNEVTSIGDHAFAYCDALTSVTFGNSAADIGFNAFRDCDALTSVTIPNSVISIDRSAFVDCDSLQAVDIGDSVTTIGGRAFAHCDALTSVTFGKSVTTIGDTAFSDCVALTSVIIPDSVTSIGYNAFSDCDALQSVTIGNGVTTIGSYAFYDCDALTVLNIPDSVITIGEEAFSYCKALYSVTIGNSVTSVGDKAFYGCDAIQSVTIGNSLTALDRLPLRGSKLQSIIISAENPNFCIVDGVIFSKDMTTLALCSTIKCGTSYIIPDRVTTIGKKAFYGCDTLTSVTIPDSATTIGDSAFYGCNALRSIIIPDSVTTIGRDAFRNCYRLKSIVFLGNSPTIGSYAFSSVTATVYYPSGDATWTDSVRQNYSGNLTWAPVGTANIAQKPTATKVIYTPNLKMSDSVLSGGKVTNAGGTPIAGTWAWVAPNNMLYAGTGSYLAVFTPADSSLDSVQTTVEVTVSPAAQVLTSQHGSPQQICTFYAGPGLEMRDMVSSNRNVDPVFVITEDEGAAYVEGTVLYSPDAGFVTVEACFHGVDVNGDGIDEYAAGSVEIHTKFTTVPMYRMYDPNAGEHFYTGSEVERNNLVAAGWKYEGVGFNYPAIGAPVYRLYNPVSGDHLYTMDEEEIAQKTAGDWHVEGVAFNSAATTEIPQYRLWNPNAVRGAWHFTSDAGELSMLIAAGWQYQGIGWYSTRK